MINDIASYNNVELKSWFLTQTTLSEHCKGTNTVHTYVTRPAKIDHLSAKSCQFLACLLYHNLITIYTTATQSSLLLQNLMGFLLKLVEKG